MFPKWLKVLVFLFFASAVFVLVYLPSYSNYQELKRTQADLQNEVQSLKDILNHLLEEERLLKEDPQYLEKVARDEFGRAAPGEILYRLVRVAAETNVSDSKD